MGHPDVCLFFRKPLAEGNYSIESSFSTMLEAFEVEVGYRPHVVEAPVYNGGLWPRIQITFATGKARRAINHITGDIHFAVLGLPKRGTILTVHDCGFMLHPNPLARFVLWLFWLKLPVARAEVITAISEATKADLIRYTGCRAEKIKVIPTIIKNHFKPSPKEFPTQKPRVLHIGMAHNKNLLRHIEALAGIDCHLHIIGKINAEASALLKARQIDYSNTWDLSDTQVQTAYHQCDLLLFASTLEGFGMPILEAQTVGRPVVTSNLSSMAEVAGDSACLVDPYSVESIRAGVLRVIADAEYREHLLLAGFKNIHRFEAATVARAYGDLYEELSGKKTVVKSKKQTLSVK